MSNENETMTMPATSRKYLKMPSLLMGFQINSTLTMAAAIPTNSFP